MQPDMINRNKQSGEVQEASSFLRASPKTSPTGPGGDFSTAAASALLHESPLGSSTGILAPLQPAWLVLQEKASTFNGR